MTERILNVLRPYASNWTGTLGRGDLVNPQREIPRVIHEIRDALRDETADKGPASTSCSTCHVGAPQSVGAGPGEPCAGGSASSSASRSRSDATWGIRCAGHGDRQVGITPQGKVYGCTPRLRRRRGGRALDDAGLARTDLDGLLVNPGHTWNDQGPIVPAPAGARPARSRPDGHDEPRRRHRVRNDPARRAGNRRRDVQHGRLRVLRRAVEAAVAAGRAHLERRGVRLRARLGGGVRLLRRQRHVCAGREPAHAPVRHDAGSARVGRRRAASLGARDPA
jgi:hypothetical protein